MSSTHIERMTEVLRQSKTLRLPGNRELTLASIRRTVDTEYLHAEAKEGDKRVAIVFGPQDGAVSATLVYEAGARGALPEVRPACTSSASRSSQARGR